MNVFIDKLEKKRSELYVQSLIDNQVDLANNIYLISNLNNFCNVEVSELGLMSLTDDQVDLADCRGFKSLPPHQDLIGGL